MPKHPKRSAREESTLDVAELAGRCLRLVAIHVLPLDAPWGDPYRSIGSWLEDVVMVIGRGRTARECNSGQPPLSPPSHMRIIGTGVDLLHLPRINALCSRVSSTRLAQRILSEDELKEWSAISPNSVELRTRFLGVRWVFPNVIARRSYLYRPYSCVGGP